jgi:acyl-[acyl carrier protein]--UDP-N-acetylglucosamine O-acyltransferase
VGNNNFISAMCNIEHHCRVGNHCTFGPSVIFSGGVEVCDEVKFGTGIFAEPFYSFKNRIFVKSGSILTVGSEEVLEKS